MRIRTLIAVLLLSAIACQPRDRQPSDGEYGGTFVISVGSDASLIFPPLTINITSAQVEAQVYEHLAEPGEKLSMIGDAGWSGRLASSWAWATDSLAVAFRIDSLARWQDGRPVRASDVRFTFELYTDPDVGSLVAPLLGNIDSVTVRDSLTAVFWFKRRTPEAFSDAAFQMRIMPEHLLAGLDRKSLQTSEIARKPVGSGPYRVARWVPRQFIELEANPEYHRGRPRIERVIFSIAPDPNSAILRVLSGEADMVDFLRPQDFAEVAKHAELKTVRYPSLVYMYLLFNLRDPQDNKRPHPIFGDRDVRRALTMAVNREHVVHGMYDTLANVAIGPFTRALPDYDSTLAQIHYAPDSARKLLDSRGWRVRGADGIREKNGRQLRFTIMVPSSSTPRTRGAVLLQEMFRQVGARVDIEQMDFPTHGARQGERRFDATMNGITADGTSSSIRQGWSVAAARSKTGSNYGSYENPAFDALVDSATAQMDLTRAYSYYRKAYQVLIDDAPAIWLAEPAMTAVMHRRIQPGTMRANGWWIDLDQWSIPAAERIARDRVVSVQSRQ
jgi:peptide/nickel transport system substrate-binding protein